VMPDAVQRCRLRRRVTQHLCAWIAMLSRDLAERF
jgi:hypothetical protein